MSFTALNLRSVASHERKIGHTELAGVLDLTADEIERLEDALRRARQWGIAGRGYDASLALQLAAWIDGGMTGDLPHVPDYLKSAGGRG